MKIPSKTANTPIWKAPPKQEDAKLAPPDVSGFVRRPDLEPFLAAIAANPVVRVVKDDEGRVSCDRGFYFPNAIRHFAEKGYYRNTRRSAATIR